MDERKIIDLTGNREEVIAPKKPSGDTAGADRASESGRDAHLNGHHGNHKKKNKKNHKKRRELDRKSHLNLPNEKTADDGENTADRADPVPEQDAPVNPGRPDEPTEESRPCAAETAAPETPGPEDEPAGEPVEIVGIRFRGVGKTYYFSPAGITFVPGDHAIVDTARGQEYGEVTYGNRMVSASEIVQPLKPVLRKADAKDAAHFEANCKLEESAKPIFLAKCLKNKLEMKLVGVEYTFDNAKLYFYYTADGRVDFRELLKDLAPAFHTRIEFRQIGVRDEARVCGGIGICGRTICCKQFLTDLNRQVTIKMAKDQGLALSSAKSNGLCGKLMCCVRFEQPVYEAESQRMPQPETEIDTPKGKAVVLESSFLTEKVKVRMIDDNSVRTFTLGELNGEEKPAKKERKTRSAEGIVLRDSFAPETDEANPEAFADETPKKPKGGNPRGGQPQKNGKPNADGKNKEKGKKESSGNREREKTGDEQPRKQDPRKDRRRFHRPDNIRAKDSGSGGKKN